MHSWLTYIKKNMFGEWHTLSKFEEFVNSNKFWYIICINIIHHPNFHAKTPPTIPLLKYKLTKIIPFVKMHFKSNSNIAKQCLWLQFLRTLMCFYHVKRESLCPITRGRKHQNWKFGPTIEKTPHMFLLQKHGHITI
jgi:hypothetical protein